jgi:5-methylcytosine-specific restriction endonuclease McrA
MCSNECREQGRLEAKRKGKSVRRARIRGALKSENVDPFKVFDRDGWRCQICMRKTVRSKRGTADDRAPELDHIMPLSKGGDHTYANTQCTCRRCNGLKSDDVYGQIPMFAT